MRIKYLHKIRSGSVRRPGRFFSGDTDMKEFKTFNQQLIILRDRGMIVPKDGSPKRFLEQENYYNVINGYKDLFLCKDNHGNKFVPEKYLPNTHFNELKALFLFDRELRFFFLSICLFLKIHSKQLFHMSFHRNIQKLIHIWKLQIIEIMILKEF